MPLSPQLRYLLLSLTQRCLIFKNPLFPGSLQPSILCLLKLTLSDKESPPILPHGGGVLTTPGISLGFVLPHHLLIGSQFFVHLH